MTLKDIIEDERAESFEEGVEKGRAEGREEGLIEGKCQKAKAMLDNGLSVAMVANISGLSEEEIRGLDSLKK